MFSQIASVTFWGGVPERWLEKPLWRCEEGHVSSFYIKSEACQADLCPMCHKPVVITFPGDSDNNVLGAEIFAIRTSYTLKELNQKNTFIKPQ